MTAADTFDAEPRAFENAVFEHSLHHVLAASRCKAAGRRSERRDKHPVEIDGQQKHLTHYDFPVLHPFPFHFSPFPFHFSERLANGFFNDSKALLFLVHIVKGNQEMLLAQ